MENTIFTDNVRIRTFVKNLRHDVRIRIFVNENDMIFNGYVYQLYDNNKFEMLYAKSVNFSFDSVSILIDTESRSYKNYVTENMEEKIS